MNFQSRCLIFIFSIFLTASANITNESSVDEVRQPRVIGRIVKLYSGSRPDPITCIGEGFQADPTNCAVFYRCIQSGPGRYTIFRFQCGPGTIYDPETEVCNHPKSTKRSECIDILERASPNKGSVENEIDNEFQHELPFPINLKTNSPEQTTAKREIFSSTSPKKTTVPQFSQSISIAKTISLPLRSFATSKPTRPQSKQHKGDICTTDGFMGDSENCRKFYRCVGNGRGNFIRYEFSCSESTVWDDELQSCNHPWSVKRRRCGRDTDEEIPNALRSQSQKDESDADASASAVQEQIQINYGNKVTQIQHQINNSTKIKQNQTQINYGKQGNQSQKQENYAPNSKQNQKQVNHGSAVSQIQSQANYGDKTIQSQVQINHSKQSSQTQSQITDKDDGSDTKPKPSDTKGTQCTESGFKGDPNDCKKFYRCVDDGKGSYTRYEFSCGDGTVWDSSIEGCNHEWAVKDCGRKTDSSSNTVSTTTESKTTQNNPYTTQKTATENNEDDSYANQNQETSSSEAEITSTTKKPVSNDVCTSSGFVGDSKDCKKFYRCVDNGNGGYTKYEFKCGEGTVWDQKIEGCNHPWSVEKCGGITEDYHKVETTTKGIQPALSMSSTQQTTIQNEDDNGYGEHEETSQPTTTSPASNQGDSGTGTCKSSGFMGDSNDCKKFYRCVDNGNGVYTRYEFSCGEGTVWDQSIEGCNHAWAVKKCGNSETQTEIINQEQQNTATTAGTVSDTDSDEGYNQSPAQEPENSESSTSTKKPTFSKSCTQEGFMGDENDCRKFYRCVDNGQGGFIKYDFDCGEGTIWDQEIQGCNHPNSNIKCGTQQLENTSKEPNAVHDNDEVHTESAEEITTEPSSQNTKPPSSNDVCESEGFFGDSKDCKKFHRCVDNGNGGYTKYDFSCGDGTVWDQEIKSCNHENSNNECKKQSSSSETQSTSTQQQTTTSDQTSSTTTQKTMTSTTSSSLDKCDSEGFYANSQDCKKFFRCVDNGKGGYTKYDFICGDGTIWVQEIQACDHDNDDSTCHTSQNSNDNNYQTEQPPETSSTTQSQSTQSDENQNDKEDQSDEKCTTPGFFAIKNDCRKFYRCVDNGNGGFTKYDFTCGEGTAWDSDLQTCNHISEVKTCDSSTQNQSQSDADCENNKSTEGTSTSQSSTESSKPYDDSCEKEGYFGNSQDCKKFYRCVDNGKGGFTKYDFDCGEGTIWDQDVQTCNHPQDVANPSCKEHSGTSSSSSSSSSESESQTSSTTTESSSQAPSNCTQDDSSKNPSKKNVTCEKEGFYPDPNDCKKFYRCVDWDGNGQRFSVFHFDCGEGTIWDPQLQTCNYEDSVYPPRDCSGSQSESENIDGETTTTESSTSTTEETTTTTEKSTTDSQTTTEKEDSTTQSSTTQKTTTTQEPTTSEQTTTTQQSTTSDETTTQQSTTESTTTTTTTEKSTTQESTTTEQTTTHESTTSEQTTTESSTETTTQQSTQETTTTEKLDSTTQETTTQESTTEDSGDTTTESNGTTTTTENDQTTTQSSDSDSTTEGDGDSDKECPETDDDQYLYVCPTGFRRHPKYCNLFYQCTEDDDSHEVKVATFQCPNNTIYDESKTQCVEEDKADKKCNGEIAQKRRVKRLNIDSKQPIEVSKQRHTCPAAGHYPFERNDECSPAFLKCERAKSGKIRGMVYKCPENYVYWSVSRRCEPLVNLKYCKSSANNWKGRWEIPIERRNVAP